MVPPSRAVVARAAAIYTLTTVVAIIVEAALFAGLGRDVGLARITLLGITLGAIVATAPALAWMQRRADVMWVGLIAMAIAATIAQTEGTLSGMTVGVIVLMLVFVATAATALPDLRWHALLWCAIGAVIVFGAQFNARPSARLWQWRTPLPFAVAAVALNAIAVAVRIGVLRIDRWAVQR